MEGVRGRQGLEGPKGDEVRRQFLPYGPFLSVRYCGCLFTSKPVDLKFPLPPCVSLGSGRVTRRAGYPRRQRRNRKKPSIICFFNTNISFISNDCFRALISALCLPALISGPITTGKTHGSFLKFSHVNSVISKQWNTNYIQILSIE